MDPTSSRKIIARLIGTGILVVFASVGFSLLATHFALSDAEDSVYWKSIVIASVIPLSIAPIAYGWTARLMYQLEEQRHALDRLARSDALTGLGNRRHFVEQAERWLAEHDESAGPVVLAMVDLDHFKQINDTLGHAVGDLALCHAAAILAGAVPEDALVGRLGGEEFGLLLRGDGSPAQRDEEFWRVHMDLLRQQLAATPLVHEGCSTRLTGSFGLALARPGEDLESLLRRADAGMYEAKQTGRNRVALAA